MIIWKEQTLCRGQNLWPQCSAHGGQQSLKITDYAMFHILSFKKIGDGAWLWKKWLISSGNQNKDY